MIKLNRTDSSGNLILAKDPENGIEGIAINNGEIYVSNQSFEHWPAEDPSAIVKIEQYSSDSAKISEVYPLDVDNISGMTFFKNRLYMVSDTGNQLMTYDLQQKEILKSWDLSKTYKALKGAGLEGVAFDPDGNIYLADDRGGKIYKYKFNN